MRRRGSLRRIVVALACLCAGADVASASDLLPARSLERLGARAYWQGQVPLADGETITKSVLLDENLYLLTDSNRVYTVHAATGILRWSSWVADPGQTVRGPTHSGRYVLFTGPGSVKVLERRTGELAGEPRTLRGFIIDVVHDIATISIGELHGVRADDVLNVVRVNADGEVMGEALAQLKITVVGRRQSKGRLIRRSRAIKIQTGDRVRADVVLPLKSVKLPFAASSPAVADDKSLFVGAANQRFYSLDILSGFQHWQITTPRTVSCTPVLRDEDLYFAGQDGRIVSCTKRERLKNWVYKTEGPIFVDFVVDDRFVYVVSADRLLYCLDRKTGRREWRKRFDNSPTQQPRVVQGRVYQQVPNEGLFVLDAQTGETLWREPGGGRFLAQFGKDVYLVREGGSFRLTRVDASSGKRKAAVDVSAVAFAVAGQGDQLIVLVGKQGRMLCLRPKDSPRLRPADLAQVLRDDRKLEVVAQMVAERQAQSEGEARQGAAARSGPNLDFLDEDDWLTSHDTARPIGGSGLVEVGEEPASAKGQADSEADVEEDAEDDDAVGDDDGEDDDDDDEIDDDDEDDGDDDEADDDDEGDDEDEDDEDDDGEDD